MSNERKPHKHAAVIKAWADGKVVQVKCPGHEWEDVHWNGVLWMESNEYRVKPEPVKVRYRNYVLKNSVHLCVSMIADAPGYETPEVIERKSWFKCWIHTDWQEVEVPQ